MSRIVTLQSFNPRNDNIIFRFVCPAEDRVTVDFVHGNDIILHLSCRPENKSVVLNNFVGGEWDNEIVVSHSDLSEGTEISLSVIGQGGGDLGVTLNSASLFSGRWRMDLGLTHNIVIDDRILSVSRGGDTNLLTPQLDIPVGELNRFLVGGRIEQVKAHALRAVSIALDSSVTFVGALLAQHSCQQTATEQHGHLVFEFSDASTIKAHKSCEFRNGTLVASAQGNTPGAKIVLPKPQAVVAFDLRGIRSNAGKIQIHFQGQGKPIATLSQSVGEKASTFSARITAAQLIDTVFVTMSQPSSGDWFAFDKLILYPRRNDLPSVRGAGASPVAAGVASIPARAEGLLQAVSSLIGQVDELHVFLNGYEVEPDLPREKFVSVNIYRSQDFDDLGDAGKFYGIDKTSCDFYFTFDDDIIYPPDYVATLVSASNTFDAPVGVHGSLLKYPFGGYYDSTSRYVLHFRDSNRTDRRVHLLGTGTLCIPRKYFPSPSDFHYPNMADIWFAKFCAERDIPLYAVNRPFQWLKPIDGPSETIFDSNAREITSQKRIVEHELLKLSEQLKTMPTRRPRLLIAVKTYNRKEYITECINSIVKTADDHRFDIIVAVADDGSTDGTVEFLRELRIPFELHVILNKRRYTPGQFNDILDLFVSIRADFLFVLDDDVVFKKAGWCSRYYDAAMESGYHHLCHYNLPHAAQLFERRKEPFPPPIRAHQTFLLAAYGGVERCMGALFTVSPEMIAKVGYADEVNFFVRGLWHIDYSARACRAGFNESCRFFDIADSNRYIELQNTLSTTYTPSISWESDDFKRVSGGDEIARRWSIVRSPVREHLSRNDAKIGEQIDLRQHAPALVSLNDVFDKVYVINLDRRKDRMDKMRARLQTLGIQYTRFPAVDGESPQAKADYDQYVSREEGRAIPAQNLSSEQFFFGYSSDEVRVSHLKARFGGMPIRSSGAMAYLKTYQKILHRTLEDGARRILVLDDDCLFHRNFRQTFSDAYRELPREWRLLQLGTMQYNWEWTLPYSKHLYMPNGVLVASHAVGIDIQIVPDLLRAIEYWSMPFDMGALHYVARKYNDASFVITPNLIIQDQTESDINSSEIAEAEAIKKDNVYRWVRSDYGD